MASKLPPPRRIVTSNVPFPPGDAYGPDAEPAVRVVSENVTQQDELNGNAYRGTVYTHEKVPTNNDGTDIAIKEIPNNGLVIPNGANIRFNDLAPGQRVAMHRTQTTDYNIMLNGELYLLTPDEPKIPDGRAGKIKATICRPGDVIVQRGTLHAWENRSSEWARSVSVMIGAEPTRVHKGNCEEAIVLPECFGK